VCSRYRHALAGLIAACSCLFMAAVACAVVGAGSFKGKTSQRQPISFTVSGGHVRALDYRIVDTCPGGQKLINHDFGFSPIRIARSKFGGTFFDKAHHATALITGTFKNGVVHGSITDQTRDTATHKICTGKAKFAVRRGHR
jgi:hypothetical protein